MAISFSSLFAIASKIDQVRQLVGRAITIEREIKERNKYIFIIPKMKQRRLRVIWSN